MKLPPMALTAPSLCPRCDSPAMFEDHCVSCQMQLRTCGACHGVSGPFDRYCGFCGHEMVLGRKRSPLWRLWILAALVPLAGTLGFGISTLGGPATNAVAKLVHTGPVEQTRTLRSQALGFRYSYPADWVSYDYSASKPPQKPAPFVTAARLQADSTSAAGADGDLLAITPQSAVAVMGRPPVVVSGVDPKDPVAVLAFQVSQLTMQPPSGTTIKVVQTVHALEVDHRPGAAAVLLVSKAGSTFYLERVYVAAPGPSGVSAASVPLFRVDATAPAADWNSGDGRSMTVIIQSLRFTSKS